MARQSRNGRPSVASLLLLPVFLVMTITPSYSQSPPTRTFDIKIEQRKVERDSTAIRVQQGQTVTLRWTTDEATKIHLHGYDIEKNVAPETPTEITFKAHATGRFPITAHGFGKEHEERTLVYLEVLPH